MVRYWISLIKLGLLLGAFSLNNSSWALGQTCCQGFHIPSLQTLVMMPLSRAGDRFEDKWRKGQYSQSTAMQKEAIPSDPWTEPPSYVLDDLHEDRSVSAAKQSSVSKPASIDSDEVLASKRYAPVKVAALKTTLQTHSSLAVKNETPLNRISPQEHEPIATTDSNVRLASGTMDTPSVRVTAVSHSTHWISETRKAGEIKEKHLQRKRDEHSGISKK